MKLLDIKQFVDDEFAIDIARNTRKREYVEARSLYYKLAKENTRLSLERIGGFIRRDHATVLHGLNNVWYQAIVGNEEILESYDKFKSVLSRHKLLEESVRDYNGDLTAELVETKKELHQLKKIGLHEFESIKKELEDIKSGKDKFALLISEVSDDDRKLNDLYFRMSAAVRMIKSAQYN